MIFGNTELLRSPSKFQVFRSLQPDFGKYRNVAGKAAARELNDKAGK